MSIQKDLEELLANEVITPEVGRQIENYYQQRKDPSNNRLLMIFGVLGSFLIGLGIILIIAHNWDHLSRVSRTVIAFLPLIIGQLACGYALFFKGEDRAWSESSATFLCFAVAACMSLVSQIYNIDGELSSFVFTWMLLILPIAYLMRSSIVSMIYIVGITYYVCAQSYWTHPSGPTYFYWAMLVVILPFYFHLLQSHDRKNSLYFHHWLIPLSVAIALGTFASDHPRMIVLAYLIYFAGIYQLSKVDELNMSTNTIGNGYRVIGMLGTVTLLIILSFRSYWTDLSRTGFDLSVFTSQELIVSMVLLACALYLFWRRSRQDSPLLDPIGYVFIPIGLLIVLAPLAGIGAIVTNLVMLVVGVLTVKNGINEHSLVKLNFGLLILTVLIVSRFFDIDISFVIRGLLFLIIGAGFFIANFLIMRKNQSDEL